MRTLSANLTAAQQAASASPYVRVRLRSRNRGAETIYSTNDRLLYAQQSEGRYGGYIEVLDSTYPVAAIIRLSDYDKSIAALDYRGYRVDLGWGFDTGTDEYSEGPPVFVVEQRALSYQGKMVAELYCMSLWDLLKQMWQKQTTAKEIHFDGDVTVRYILMELLGGTSPALDADGARIGAVVRYDAATTSYSDYSSAATNPTDGADLGTAGDVELITAVDDVVWIGLAQPFDRVSLDVYQGLSAATKSFTYQYWSATGLSALANVVNNTSDFTTTGLHTITFNRPTGWVAVNRNSIDAAFPDVSLYYIAITVSALTGMAQGCFATKLTMAQDYSISLDTSDAGQGDDWKPTYSYDLQSNVAEILQDVLSSTLLALRCQNDGFHAIYADDSLSPVSYTYDGDHAFFIDTMRKTLPIPNVITYTNKLPGEVGVAAEYLGTAFDAVSVLRLGNIEEIRVDVSITSDVVAGTLATRAITKLARESAQGSVRAPMNCGQEVWDIVSIEDARMGQTVTGRVTDIVRTYEHDSGLYTIDVWMGAVRNQLSPDLLWTTTRPTNPFGSYRKTYIPPTASSNQGRFVAAGGGVRLDVLGASIVGKVGSESSAMLRFYPVTHETDLSGSLFLSTGSGPYYPGDYFILGAYNSYDLLLYSAARILFDATSSVYSLSTLYADAVIPHGLSGSPPAIGSSGVPYVNVYSENLFTDDVWGLDALNLVTVHAELDCVFDYGTDDSGYITIRDESSTELPYIGLYLDRGTATEGELFDSPFVQFRTNSMTSSVAYESNWRIKGDIIGLTGISTLAFQYSYNGAAFSHVLLLADDVVAVPNNGVLMTDYLDDYNASSITVKTVLRAYHDNTNYFGAMAVQDVTSSESSYSYLSLDRAAPANGVKLDSPPIYLTGRSNDGSAHVLAFQILNNLTSTAGAGQLDFNVGTGGAYSTKLTLYSSGGLVFYGTVIPSSSWDLGSSASWFGSSYITYENVLGYIDVNEVSPAPSAPAANTARIYSADNGAGKTQLIVKFSSGSSVVLGTEV